MKSAKGMIYDPRSPTRLAPVEVFRRIYSLGTVTLEGPAVTVRVVPTERFQMRQLVLTCEEAARSTLRLRNFLWSLSWFRIPWLVKDADFPGERIWHWRRPSLHLATWLHDRAQRKYLSRVRVDCIRIANVKLFVALTDLPAEMFYAGQPDNLHTIPCEPSQGIEVTLSGYGRPTVLVTGTVEGPYRETTFLGVSFDEQEPA